MARTNVLPEKAAFLKYELDNGGDRRRKVALQDIARLYRAGQKFSPDTRNGMELTINGLAASSDDAKVIRWCLNCIAQIGKRSVSAKSVERALVQNGGNPEIVAAAVAALSKLYSGELAACPALATVDPAIRTLAALQNTPPSKLDVSNLRIDIDRADTEVLKLALITVGLNRAFENMFHPKFSNGQLVKALGQHDNLIVKQYSVWAVIENVKLSFADLGIPMESIESESPNVQSKLLQLAAGGMPDSTTRHGIILKGTYLPSIEAREGLAKGLQYSYYEGLEDIILDWFDVESSMRVKELISEHIARFGGDCGPYADKTLEILDNEPLLKKRLLLGAEGKPLFGKIKANDLRDGTADLFGVEADPLIAKIKGTQKMTKVLMMCASPVDEQHLRLDQEARDLKEQIRLVDNPKIKIEITHAWAVRSNQVQMEVLNSSPQILHFSGHGDVGILCFENQSGESIPVTSEAIEGLVKLCSGIECLILNACYSETIAKQAAPHLEAVIGCSGSIGDEAAVKFTSAFYRGLAHGNSYQKSYEFALNDLQFAGLEAEAKKYQIFSSS